MSNEPWLILDGHNLANRAYHAMGEVLSHGQMQTGMAFGFVGTLLSLMERFSTTRVIFAFDCGRSKRFGLHEGYKGTRRAKHEKATEEEKQKRTVFYRSIDEFVDQLYRAGFRNIFMKNGYEADDVIASVLNKTVGVTDKTVMVSSDHDLFQLLSEDDSIWHPHSYKLITWDGFVKTYGTSPFYWIKVKSIAGCKTDDIPGVPGVGEKTAIKYILGTLKKGTETERKIEDWLKSDQYFINKKLVALPYKGCPVFQTQPDQVTGDSWNAFCRAFGIVKHLDAFPGLKAKSGFGLKKQRSALMG